LGEENKDLSISRGRREGDLFVNFSYVVEEKSQALERV